MASQKEKVAKEWIELKAQKMELEHRLDELKEVLEGILQDEPERSAEFCGFKFTLSEVEREFFKLSEAKKKIDGRMLKPFITLSKFMQIRTTWAGGDDSLSE